MEKNIEQIGQLFDSSMLDSKNLTDEEFKSYLVSKVQELLNREFPDVMQKRKLRVCRDRIQCACPVCRDSMKDFSKKRGNFILSGKFAGGYKCFNCGFYMPIDKFFNRYHIPLSLDSIDYLATHHSDLDSYRVSNGSTNSINCLFEQEEADKYAIDKEWFARAFNLLKCEINEFHKGANYIKKRHLTNFQNYLYDPNRDLLFILNLTSSEKIIGLQIRRMKSEKGKPKYQTYSLRSLYKYFLKDEKTEIPDFLDNLSMMFNIFQVNINSPILVTEGPLDAFLLPNCIATTGANKNIQVDLPFWFVYDSDKTGNDLAMKKISLGYKVFLWDKLKKDYSLPKRPKWDINDVVDYCLSNQYKIPNWYLYFSNSEWDLIDI